MYPLCAYFMVDQLWKGKDMTLTTEVSKFESWIKTLELKFFKGKLHQKVVSPNPGDTPDHAWVPIAAHDVDAPAAGEPIASHPARRAEDHTDDGDDSDTTGKTSSSTGQAPNVA